MSEESSADDQALERLKKDIERLNRAKKKQQSAAPSDHHGAVRHAFRLILDFSVPILLGIWLGLWLDKEFSTTPVFLLIFLLLGMGTGFMNSVRLSGGYTGAVGFKRKQPPKQ